MNTIIIGCGKVGQKLAEKLSQEENQNITVVDLKYDVVQDIINQYDAMGVVGSGASFEVLLEAGIEDADILIAVTGSDEVNLLTCLIAKKAGNCQTIARVRKPEYSRELHLFRNDLGLAMVINPELTAASEIARILRFPSAIQIDTFAKGRVEILKFKVPGDSVLDEIKVSEINSKLNTDILVCGVERGDEAFIPDGSFVIRKGDLVSIVAAPLSGSEFFRKIGVKTNRVKDTMIVGGGATSYYLADKLIHRGIKVKIIEKDTRRCEELCQMLPKATIINADGTENRVLLEEGLENAESFVSLTGIDEENIMLSLFAKSKMNGKVISKVNRVSYDDVIASLDLDTVIYPKDITAEYIVRFVRAKQNSIDCDIETMHLILDDKAEALEFTINENSPVSGIPLADLQLKANVLIACINRQGRIIIPRGQDAIRQGDTVIVVTTHLGFKDINDILQ
ncbi:MAG: Trk system potassium transporter TrkA [Ruminococcaceae bacterium]|nr:Trk system potassium transporter TrkA [Oscillospiraceae bacterium]